MELNLQSISRDPKGYLLDQTEWNPTIAKLIAQEENIQLTPPHWEIIELLQKIYKKAHRYPSLRGFIQTIKIELDPQKANSPYLFELFPKGPIQQAAKIGGLPKPLHCL